MGKGLDIAKTGTHIAFTAGTGLLIFIDLVAHLVRKNCGLLTPAEDKMLDIKRFKFVLFSSFQKREDSIGLEMCENLMKVCEKLGLSNFEFYLRLSSNKSAVRWDQAFLEK